MHDGPLSRRLRPNFRCPLLSGPKAHVGFVPQLPVPRGSSAAAFTRTLDAATGCMPTKALVDSAYAAHLARRAADYGVMIDAPIRMISRG